MAIVSIPFTFSAGATIIASQHNSNFQTIYNDYDGNIDNTNISLSAGIVYSKLSLTGGIVNADINASAAIANSKLNLATVAQDTTLNGKVLIGATHQGDVFYDNGTQITRLTPGTSGQFLKTQGASANPIWATALGGSSLFFHYAAATGSAFELATATINTNAGTATYRFLYSPSTGAGVSTVMTGKYIKLAGITTVTIYCELWGGSGAELPQLQVTIGALTPTVIATTAGITTSGTWVNGTITVSSLVTGTVYDISIALGKDIDAGGSAHTKCGSIFMWNS